MYTEITENILPHALMIGVPYDLFWDLNPRSLKPFIKAFNLKQENDDRNMWLQGIYIRMAVGSTLSKECKYPKQPLTQVKKQDSDMVIIKDRFLRHAELINSRFRKGDDNGKRR